jgi:hypothetical protein
MCWVVLLLTLLTDTGYQSVERMQAQTEPEAVTICNPWDSLQEAMLRLIASMTQHMGCWHNRPAPSCLSGLCSWRVL